MFYFILFYWIYPFIKRIRNKSSLDDHMNDLSILRPHSLPLFTNYRSELRQGKVLITSKSCPHAINSTTRVIGSVQYWTTRQDWFIQPTSARHLPIRRRLRRYKQHKWIGHQHVFRCSVTKDSYTLRLPSPLWIVMAVSWLPNSTSFCQYHIQYVEWKLARGCVTNSSQN